MNYRVEVRSNKDTNRISATAYCKSEDDAVALAAKSMRADNYIEVVAPDGNICWDSENGRREGGYNG